MYDNLLIINAMARDADAGKRYTAAVEVRRNRIVWIQRDGVATSEGGVTKAGGMTR